MINLIDSNNGSKAVIGELKYFGPQVPNAYYDGRNNWLKVGTVDFNTINYPAFVTAGLLEYAPFDSNLTNRPNQIVNTSFGSGAGSCGFTDGSAIFVSTNGFIRQTQDGLNFIEISSLSLIRTSDAILDILYNKFTGDVYAVSSTTVYKSSDKGFTWSIVPIPATTSVSYLYFHSTGVYFYRKTSDKTIYKIKTGETTVRSITVPGLSSGYITWVSKTSAGTLLILSTVGGEGLFRSVDDGVTFAAGAMISASSAYVINGISQLADGTLIGLEVYSTYISLRKSKNDGVSWTTAAGISNSYGTFQSIEHVTSTGQMYIKTTSYMFMLNNVTSPTALMPSGYGNYWMKMITGPSGYAVWFNNSTGLRTTTTSDVTGPFIWSNTSDSIYENTAKSYQTFQTGYQTFMATGLMIDSALTPAGFVDISLAANYTLTGNYRVKNNKLYLSTGSRCEVEYDPSTGRCNLFALRSLRVDKWLKTKNGINFFQYSSTLYNEDNFLLQNPPSYSSGVLALEDGTLLYVRGDTGRLTKSSPDLKTWTISTSTVGSGTAIRFLVEAADGSIVIALVGGTSGYVTLFRAPTWDGATSQVKTINDVYGYPKGLFKLPNNTLVMFYERQTASATDGNVFRIVSYDNGLTWVDQTVLGVALGSIIQQKNRLFSYGTSSFVSEDGGLTWSTLAGGLVLNPYEQNGIFSTALGANTGNRSYGVRYLYHETIGVKRLGYITAPALFYSPTIDLLFSITGSNILSYKPAVGSIGYFVTGHPGGDSETEDLHICVK